MLLGRRRNPHRPLRMPGSKAENRAPRDAGTRRFPLIRCRRRRLSPLIHPPVTRGRVVPEVGRSRTGSQHLPRHGYLDEGRGRDIGKSGTVARHPTRRLTLAARSSAAFAPHCCRSDARGLTGQIDPSRSLSLRTWNGPCCPKPDLSPSPIRKSERGESGPSTARLRSAVCAGTRPAFGLGVRIAWSWRAKGVVVRAVAARCDSGAWA